MGSEVLNPFEETLLNLGNVKLILRKYLGTQGSQLPNQEGVGWHAHQLVETTLFNVTIQPF